VEAPFICWQGHHNFSLQEVSKSPHPPDEKASALLVLLFGCFNEA